MSNTIFDPQRPTWRAALVTLAGMLCGVIPAQAENPQGLYFYDANGPQPLVASTDTFVVRLREPASNAAREWPASLPAAARPQDLPQPLADLEDRLMDRGRYVVRATSRVELESRAAVDYALPVLYRPGSDVPIYPSEQIVVRFKRALGAAELADLAARHGCDVRPARGEHRYVLTVRDPMQRDPIGVANTLHERRDLVDYAHPDFFLPKVAYAPPVIDDPIYHSHQWHLDGDVDKGAAAGTDINVEAAWDDRHGPNAQGSPGVVVSVLDECVEKLHPDLFPNWVAGLDLDVDPPDDDPSPSSGQQHGTACAGLAVAAGNTIGVRGVAPRCGLIGVKFFGSTVSETADGFLFSMDPDDDGDHSDGAAIMSNSWGYADGTLLPPDVVNAINTVAINGRNGKGCLVLFASANHDHTVNGVSALAQLPTVMAIGGTNSNREHTEFSDVGPEVALVTPTNDRGDDGVRLPWLDITTVDNTGNSGYNGLPDLNYTNAFGGTSAATPIAAGVLALIWSQDESMTAAQVRSIAQHTAVRIDEPYGRFDETTGHSHRLGFGRADAGAAVAAAHAGLRWPDRIKTLAATPLPDNITLVWSEPPQDTVGSLLVASRTPFAWRPADGEAYTVGQEVAPGVEVIFNGPGGLHADAGATTGAFFYAVYPRGETNLYGFGAKTHLIRNGSTVFFDNSEGPDPGWTHGGSGDEWTRGIPTSALSFFSQAVGGSGPLAGTHGSRAIGGNRCWGTDLLTRYDSNADAYLQTPLLNLTGISDPVFLEYQDWCLLETFYDECRVEVVDVDGELLGTVEPDAGGDYDWTRRVYDISEYVGQPVRVRFRIISDDTLQRDGWFIDEVRVMVAAGVPLPPVASDIYAELPQDGSTTIVLRGGDPDPGTIIDYIITELPQHGTLTEPDGTPVMSVPHTLPASVVQFHAAAGYEGGDAFGYRTADDTAPRALQSNPAVVTLSIGTPVVAYSFDLETNPGWLTEGAWAYGQPAGAQGDPTSGFTGTKVYGYNLAGAYPANLPPTRLTTLPMNCTGLSRVTLSFARWLGIEAGSFDDASIEVTHDGENWTTVWAHSGGDLEESAWSMQSYNIGAVADDQPFVQVRWTMGATDSGVQFAGWNIDDIQILALGEAPGNQPPLASPALVSTAQDESVAVALSASDPEQEALTYVIVELPAGGTLSDPASGPITEVPYTLLNSGQLVEYLPDPDFSGFDTFKFRAAEPPGGLQSNPAAVTIEVLDPAVFPFVDDFEALTLSPHWAAHSTAAGRIRLTSEHGPQDDAHIVMDSGSENTFALNELTLTVDLEGQSKVLLRYDWKQFAEEVHALPSSWVGSANGDGVGISTDGLHWHKIADLFDPDLPDGVYETVTLDLDAAAQLAGLAYTSTFRIRFQQYDNFAVGSDGIALDNISILQGTADPLITTGGLPIAYLGEPFGPQAMLAIGGDLPLQWSTPLVYSEAVTAASGFAEVGEPQGWSGDDVVFDYELPFSFPFYGQSYTAVRIATDGWINFGPHVGSTWNNSTVLLSFNKRIAVLWDDLQISGGGDIYIDESVPGAVTIRWDATQDLAPCRFSATLLEDGRIQLHYGEGNMPITATVGVSSGLGTDYLLSQYDSSTHGNSLDQAPSLAVDYTRLPDGLVMSADGVITGVPVSARRFNTLFRVADQSERSDQRSIPMIVLASFLGDYNADGSADILDFAGFQICFSGAGGSVSEGCEIVDMNTDGVVDLLDYVLFLQLLDE